MLSTQAIINELAYMSDHSSDIVDFLDEANDLLEREVISEAQYDKITKHLRLEILDVEKFIKVNECKVVDDPRAFIKNGIPSSRGLLSNEIFGITRDERAGTYAYIDLHGSFMDPSCYKAWIRIDNNIRNIVAGIGTYRINDKGYIIEDPAGETGIEFLRKNLNKIKFKSSDSIKRDIKIQYLEKNRDKIFIKKYIVIPPYYRDKNSGSGKSIGLGGINKLYNNLIIATNALQSTADYMFDASDAMRYRVQETILCIYDWFCGNSNANITVEMGGGMSGKLGILRRTNMSKTADFSSRLVLSACELKVEKPEDMMVTFDRSAIPLSAAIAEFRDFITFHVKRFFENEFMGHEQYPVQAGNGTISYVKPEDPAIIFSDERIRREMERYLHGYNNRFVPIEIPVEGTEQKYYMQFKGRLVDPKDATKNPEAIYHRRLTWCDVFFIAATEATKDKQILVTRFPIDKYSNQITTGIILSSTKETEPMYIEDTYYPYYPKIREEDIGSNTSNRFIDTMQISNLYLPGMCADFDGDQITCKGVYLEESNNELKEFRNNNKQNFIDFGCTPLREISSDVCQSVYALTRVLPDMNNINKSISFS